MQSKPSTPQPARVKKPFLRRYVWVPIAVIVMVSISNVIMRERGGLPAALPALLRQANAESAAPPQHASPAPAMHALANGATRPADASTAAASQPATSATTARPKNDGTLHRTDFDTLSTFRWVDPPVGAWNSAAKKSPATRPANVIPPDIRALDNQTVAIKGFMYPLDVEKGKTKEFILMRVVPACLYCNPPRINEFVVVKTADGQRVTIDMDNAVTVTGNLSVGPEFEDGIVTSIYRLSATAVK